MRRSDTGPYLGRVWSMTAQGAHKAPLQLPGVTFLRLPPLVVNRSIARTRQCGNGLNNCA